jgi:hypothetical protein
MERDGSITQSGTNRPEFSKGCFWDYNYDKFDLEESKNFIIARILSRGNTEDEKKLFDYYGLEVIKNEIVKIRYLDKKILNYYSIVLGIEKENFRASKNKAETWI